MTQYIKCSQQAPVSDSIAARPTASGAGSASTYQQPSMQRHTHPIPSRKAPPPSDQQSALLQALAQQNALMTDLIASVNGLAALLCSQKDR